MGRIGFTSSRADPNVWFRLSTRSTGEVYYEYVLLDVDNFLVILERAESVLRKEIGKFFVLKDESVGPPSMYLGGKLRQVELLNGEQHGHSVQANMSNLQSRMFMNILQSKV